MPHGLPIASAPAWPPWPRPACACLPYRLPAWPVTAAACLPASDAGRLWPPWRPLARLLVTPAAYGHHGGRLPQSAPMVAHGRPRRLPYAVPWPKPAPAACRPFRPPRPPPWPPWQAGACLPYCRPPPWPRPAAPPCRPPWPPWAAAACLIPCPMPAQAPDSAATPAAEGLRACGRTSQICRGAWCGRHASAWPDAAALARRLRGADRRRRASWRPPAADSYALPAAGADRPAACMEYQWLSIVRRGTWRADARNINGLAWCGAASVLRRTMPKSADRPKVYARCSMPARAAHINSAGGLSHRTNGLPHRKNRFFGATCSGF